MTALLQINGAMQSSLSAKSEDPTLDNTRVTNGSALGYVLVACSNYNSFQFIVIISIDRSDFVCLSTFLGSAPKDGLKLNSSGMSLFWN